MYQPRRAADLSGATAPESDGYAAAFRTAPRRQLRTRSQLMRTRVAPAAVSVALLATSGAFALNLKASEQPTAAVPAPERDDAITRSADRAVEETPATEAPATEAAATEEGETQGAEAFVAGSWSSAFGSAAGTKYAQSDLTVRAQASDDAESLGSIKEAGKVSITDKVVSGFRQIAFNGKVGYVSDAQLGAKAPVKETPKPAESTAAKAPAKSAAKSSAPAAPAGGSSEKYSGSGEYSGPTVLGLKPRAMVVYNAVTAKWSFTSIGGYRASNNRSNHGLGGAIDFMTYKDSAKGWEVAKYVAANADAFKVDHIIFEQKIWTPYRPYWRPMEDRGSITANHYDHVHVSVKL